MSMEKPIEAGRFLFTQFADDIRQELGGKVTLVGVYQSEMIFQSFPSVIPKLAVIMTAVTPVDHPFEKLSFALYKDEEVVQRLEIPSETLKQAVQETNKQSQEGHIMEVQFAALMGSVNIDGPCTFVGKIETENGTIQGKSLKVTASNNII